MKSTGSGPSPVNRSERIILAVVMLASISLAGCEKEEDQGPTQTIHVIIDTVFSEPNTVQDIDGNIYPVLQIGAQRWMGRNLRTSRYDNGDPIAYVPNAQTWTGLNSGAWAIYESDPGFASVYGNLYNFYVVLDQRNVCPVGWHVPSDADWKELESELGMPLNEVDLMGSRGSVSNIGGKLKSTQLWSPPNTGASDSTGFEGLPGGFRSGNGAYLSEGEQGWWWTSTEVDTNYVLRRALYHNSQGCNRLNTDRRVGASIRCVED
jgi:uncharacterized protein (TIGR02145 family)